MIGIGVDFGTSNSTVACFDGKQLRFVHLETSGPIMPTAIHLNRSFAATTGTDAVELYVEENRARLVQLVAEVIGEQAVSIGDGKEKDSDGVPEMSRNAVYGPLEDQGLPGRLFLGLKRLLGNDQIDRLWIFNRPFRLVALITRILLRMRLSVEAVLGNPVQQVHIGRPVHFEGKGGERSNQVAVDRMTEAGSHAGFRNVRFYPEPVAATLSYLSAAKLTGNGIVLAVDFGGGTLDLCVVRYSEAQFEVLSTAGIGLGGDRIDQLIFRRLLFPLLGEGEWWSRKVEGRLIETPFPFHEYEEGLLNWAITHTLNQNQYKTRIAECIANGGPAAIKFERLKDLINYNYSYNVFRAIRKAKAELSSTEETMLDIPELNLLVPFSRSQLDAMLAEVLATLSGLITQVVAEASLQCSQIDVVVRTGGTSQIVAVQRLLEERFPGKVTAHDPFTSVAGGLAIASYNAHRSQS